jgi:hypothetical protein
MHPEMTRDPARPPALYRRQSANLRSQLQRDHRATWGSAAGGSAESRGAPPAGRLGGRKRSKAHLQRGQRAMGRSACSRMPPRCQSALAAGYPDASLSVSGLPGGSGRRLGGGHASADRGDCADSAGPPLGSSAVGRLGCNAASSSADRDRTKSTRRSPGGSDHRRNDDSRGAGPAAPGLDSNPKTGEDHSAGSVSSQAPKAGDGGLARRDRPPRLSDPHSRSDLPYPRNLPARLHARR